MIHYDPHKWLDHFFDIRGTLVREISLRVGLCVLWAALIAGFHFYVRPVNTSAVLHSLVGVALGLLLVFRTNASYDRYWEGRRLWGGIVNETRNLIRAASVHLREDAALLERLTIWTGIFPWTAIGALRGNSNHGPLSEHLPAHERSGLREAQHPALHVAQQMTAILVQAKERRLISDMVFFALDQNIQLLVQYLGGCERIRKTPLPFAYVVHLRRALVIYCFTLPFALLDSFGWFTILDVLLVAYTFFGIEEIGVEIEGPFGDDANDLPMEEIAETIRNNVLALSGVSQTRREPLPEGL